MGKNNLFDSPMVKLGVGIVFIVIIFIVGVMYNNQKIEEARNAPSEESKKSPLEIIELKFGEDPETPSLKSARGIMVNNSNKKYGYIQLSFSVYDKSGAQIGSTLTTINDLEPGGRWKFTALVTEKGATSVKVSDLTGF